MFYLKLMKAYWVLNYDITNIEEFTKYRANASPMIRELVKQEKAKVLVVNDEPNKQVLEGNPGNSMVIVEFEVKK